MTKRMHEKNIKGLLLKWAEHNVTALSVLAVHQGWKVTLT